MRRAIGITGLLLMSACATTDMQNAPDAVLTNPSETTRLEITEVVSKALNGRKVTIAPDTLTKSQHMYIELKEAMGPDGLPIMGRRFDRPDHFTLKKSGDTCALVHVETGEVYTLDTAVCEEL